jgi:signal transduction histidine kinase
MRPLSIRPTNNKTPLFPIVLSAHETQTVFIRLENSGTMVIDPILYTPEYFWEKINPNREAFISAFLAIIVFFTLYNVVLFFSLREISFIYYFLAMSSMFVMQSTLFGVAYEYAPFLGLWNLTIAPNIAGAFFIVFSVLFVSSYFELNLYSPKIDKWLSRILFAVYTPIFVLLLIPQTYSSVLPLISLLGIIVIFLILYLTYIGYQKSPISSHYIFMGWLISGSLMILYIMELIGILHLKLVDDLTIRIGTLIEMIFFSFALGDKLRYLKMKTAEAEIKALESEKQMLIKAKLATAGETVGNIAHQWRQPLNRLSTVLLNIQSDLYFKEEIDKELLVKKTQESELILKDMSNTIDLFLNFFSNTHSDEIFNTADAINDAISIMGETLQKNSIELTMDIDKKTSIQGNRSELAQVILNLLSNAQNALLFTQTSPALITIHTKKVDEKIHIDISDNGGGIKIIPIESVFDPYISSGNNKNGAGLGLYIVKNLIIQRFKGDIHVINRSEGAAFIIEIPSAL